MISRKIMQRAQDQTHLLCETGRRLAAKSRLGHRQLARIHRAAACFPSRHRGATEWIELVDVRG